MGKARDGSECYTRQNKSGANYVTCEGTQKKRAARRKLKAGGEPPVLVKSKPIPPQSARARGRRSAAARKLTTRPPGRIETGSINPGIVETGEQFATFGALTARKLTTRPPGRIETGSINPGIVETGEQFATFLAPAKNIDPRLPDSSEHAFLVEYDETGMLGDIPKTTAPGFQVTTLPGDIYEIRDGPYTPEEIAEGAEVEYVGKVSKEFVKIEFTEGVEAYDPPPDWPTEEEVKKVTGIKELKAMARRFADHSGRGDFPEEFQVDNSGIDELKKLSKPKQRAALRANILKGIEIEKRLYIPREEDPDALPPGTMLLMIDGDKIFDKNPAFDNDEIMRFEFDDTDEETDEEIEEERAGVVMPEGPLASFEGLFESAAPVEPEEEEQGVNEDILAEVIPGLLSGESKNIDPRLPDWSRDVILQVYDESMGPDVVVNSKPGFMATSLPGDIYQIKDKKYKEDIGKVSKEFVKIRFVKDDSDEDRPDWPTEEQVEKEKNLKTLRAMARRFADHSGRGDFPEEFQVDNSGVDDLIINKVSKPEQIKALRANILKGIEIEKKLYRPSKDPHLEDPSILASGTMTLLVDADKLFDKNPFFDNGPSYNRLEFDDE